MAEEVEIDPAGSDCEKLNAQQFLSHLKRSPDASAVARNNGIEIQPMRQVDIHLSGWKFAAAMGELTTWLDRNHCVPEGFAISKLANGDLLVRVEFGDDAMAEVFEREFAR